MTESISHSVMRSRQRPRGRSWSFAPACRAGACRTTACLLLLGLAAVVRASPVYVADVPDFYQHQLSGWDYAAPFNRPGNFSGYADPTIPSYSTLQPLDDGGPGIQWERNGGWCYITAFTNAFYQLDKRGVAGLFDRGGSFTWLERMNYAIGDFAIKAWGFGGIQRQSASQFVDGLVGPGRVSIDTFTWDDGLSRVMRNGDATPFESMYSLYTHQLAIGNAAVLNLVNPGEPNAGWWWSGSYHMVAAAGYDEQTSAIYFADPNGRGSDPGTRNWGYPYGTNDPLPVGAAYYESSFMDQSGLLSGDGAFSGALVTKIFVLSIVPEPPTAFMALAGLACGGFVVFRRRRGCLTTSPFTGAACRRDTPYTARTVNGTSARDRMVTGGR